MPKAKEPKAAPERKDVSNKKTNPFKPQARVVICNKCQARNYYVYMHAKKAGVEHPYVNTCKNDACKAHLILIAYTEDQKVNCTEVVNPVEYMSRKDRIAMSSETDPTGEFKGIREDEPDQENN